MPKSLVLFDSSQCAYSTAHDWAIEPNICRVLLRVVGGTIHIKGRLNTQGNVDEESIHVIR